MDSDIWENPIFFMVWCWCLLKANHETRKFPFNGQAIEIKAGSFITGVDKASKELYLSAQTYRTAIKYLKSTSRLTSRSTNRFTIISICKWEEYQKEPTSQLTSELTNHQQTTNKPLTTNKKDKNYKNDKKPTAESFEHLQDYQTVVKWFRGMEDVENAEGLAKFFFRKYDHIAIGRALKHSSCESRSKFTDLIAFYSSKPA